MRHIQTGYAHISVKILAGQNVMGEPLWKSVPTWFLVATNDEALPPDAERQFASRMGATTIEVAASHVAMVSQPAQVAQLIEDAASGAPAAERGGTVTADR